MKISSLSPSSTSQMSRPSLIDGLARRSLFRLLGRIEGGSITIKEGERTQRFGDGLAISDHQPALHVSLEVNNPAFYRLLITRGSIGAGEAYMLKFWDTSDLTTAVQMMCRNMTQLEQLDGGFARLGLLAQKVKHWMSPNTMEGARRNIHAHYDLSNELFAYFLDDRMMYSGAIYPDADSDLETAATFKLQEIGRKLEVTEEDHIIEIGSGWGGLAIYLAERHGCRVTTTTISRQQYEYACDQVKQKGLGDRVTVLNKDYRELRGQFDKLVSIEMIEAVGHRFLPTYFRQCNDLLKRGGKMLLQAITIPEQRYDYARRNVDFIQRYIFPGGSLPSIESILNATGRFTDLQIEKLDDIGLHYARTLDQWHQRFMRDPDRIRQMGFDDAFIRLWRFYLCYCEGGFRERAISTNHVLLRKV